MVPEEVDFARIRDEAVALPPSSPDGYRRVLLLGTTGAGKTTVVRQLIGTDPATERFPSTSTAKTTIHDTEIIVDDGPWRAVVTFAPSDEIREYLNECISAAVLAASKGADDATILRRLLNHVNQRYRFSYVLGTGPSVKSVAFGHDDEDEDDQGDDELFTAEELGDIDLDVTEELLQRVVSQLRSVSQRLGERLRDELAAAEEGDERVLEELFEEELDNLLRDDEEFHAVADALMDEIEKRFELLPQGTVKKTKQGWPLSWHAEWDTDARRDFLKAITRFSSNYAPYYGRLLTPLVNGVRVSGPFTPTWLEGQSPPKLVILDGEGLGHTPTSASSVSTGVSRRIEVVDAVLLIDNATQPMQAAPVAAMREVISTGNARKLIVAFTHFDEVKGDNLPNADAKAQHVLASAENVLAAFGEELGAHAERAVRKRLDGARFFLGGLHEPLATNTAAGRRTVKQLRGLLQAIEDVVDRPQPAFCSTGI